MNSKNKKRRTWVLPLLILVILVIFIRVFIGQPSYIPSGSMENALMTGDYVWVNRLTYGSMLPRRFSDIPLINVFTWIAPLREKDKQNDWGYNRLYKGKKPSNGDVTVYAAKDASGALIVKRIAGCPGDTIEIKSGVLMVNGVLDDTMRSVIKTQSGNPARFPIKTTWTSHEYGPLVVPGKGTNIEIDQENYLWIKDIANDEGNILTTVRDSIFFCNGKRINSYSFNNDYYFMLGDNRQNSFDSRFDGFVSEQRIEGTIGIVLFSLDKSSGIGFNKNRFFKKVY